MAMYRAPAAPSADRPLVGLVLSEPRTAQELAAQMLGAALEATQIFGFSTGSQLVTVDRAGRLTEINREYWSGACASIHTPNDSADGVHSSLLPPGIVRGAYELALHSWPPARPVQHGVDPRGAWVGRTSVDPWSGQQRHIPTDFPSFQEARSCLDTVLDSFGPATATDRGRILALLLHSVRLPWVDTGPLYVIASPTDELAELVSVLGNGRAMKPHPWVSGYSAGGALSAALAHPAPVVQWSVDRSRIAASPVLLQALRGRSGKLLMVVGDHPEPAPGLLDRCLQIACTPTSNAATLVYQLGQLDGRHRSRFESALRMAVVAADMLIPDVVSATTWDRLVRLPAEALAGVQVATPEPPLASWWTAFMVDLSLVDWTRDTSGHRADYLPSARIAQIMCENGHHELWDDVIGDQKDLVYDDKLNKQKCGKAVSKWLSRHGVKPTGMHAGGKRWSLPPHLPVL